MTLLQKKGRKGSTEEDLEEWKKSRQLLKPKDQVELADWVIKFFFYLNFIFLFPLLLLRNLKM